MRFPRTALIAAAVAIALTMVSGCSNSDPKSTVEVSKPYNDADVSFATDMIQHHAQALQMVDLCLGRDLDPKIAALADEIRTEQTPEIEQMVDLLNRWDKQPIPATSRDHANAHGGGDAHTDLSMPGMMSNNDMKALEAAPGDDFEAMWVAVMIEHHQGAIEMASTEASDGEDKKAKALAAAMVASQQTQPKMMQELRR